MLKEKIYLPTIKHIIAVASGKGGVGKSTVAFNLAVGLSKRGLKVGLLDADIYGPSLPKLLGLSGKPVLSDNQFVPFEKHGIKAMSMGFLIEEHSPLIWRGPMVQTAVKQLFKDVKWGELDFLIVDMPPGTGDAHLTLAQSIPLMGCIIVSTPQDLAWIDARKALEMFQRLHIPILGIIENMSGFECLHCRKSTSIFGSENLKAVAASLKVPFLGSLPLDPQIGVASETGVSVFELKNSSVSESYETILEKFLIF